MTARDPAPAEARRLPLWAHLAPLLLGVLIVIVGFFFFDPLWPAQDMPPDLAERYRRASARAGEIYRFGGWTCIAGLAWFAAVSIFRAAGRSRRR